MIRCTTALVVGMLYVESITGCAGLDPTTDVQDIKRTLTMKRTEVGKLEFSSEATCTITHEGA